MKSDLEKLLVTEEMIILGRDKADLTVTVSEDEYLHAQCFLEELLPYKGIDTVEDNACRTVEISGETHDRSMEIQPRVSDLCALDDMWKR